ncbi:MAG: hypothetical protein JO319_17900 [Acidobacteriaceae bacterium]|nr:hypothetical protein [Acidobacteriaceae bacterium]
MNCRDEFGSEKEALASSVAEIENVELFDDPANILNWTIWTKQRERFLARASTGIDVSSAAVAHSLSLASAFARVREDTEVCCSPAAQLLSSPISFQDAYFDNRRRQKRQK